MRTILVHGASTAAGWFDMESAGWVNRLHMDALHVNMASPQEAISIQNTSIPGSTLPGIMKNMDRVEKYKKLGSLTTILEIGLNESKIIKNTNKPLVSLDDFRNELEIYGDYIRSVGGNTIYIGTEALLHDTIATHNGHIYENDLVEEYDELIRKQAESTQAPYISISQLFAETGVDRMLAPDGYHPNALGHTAIYQAVKTTLSEYENFSTVPRSKDAVLDITNLL